MRVIEKGHNMTRDEIMNMSAGREMDMLIADKVMGWILRGDGLYTTDPNDNSLFGNCWGSNDNEDTLNYFNPSEDIVAAMVILEKLRHEYDIEICAGLNGFEVYGYYGSVSEQTLPLAISRYGLLYAIEAHGTPLG